MGSVENRQLPRGTYVERGNLHWSMRAYCSRVRLAIARGIGHAGGFISGASEPSGRRIMNETKIYSVFWEMKYEFEMCIFWLAGRTRLSMEEWIGLRVVLHSVFAFNFQKVKVFRDLTLHGSLRQYMIYWQNTAASQKEDSQLLFLVIFCFIRRQS